MGNQIYFKIAGYVDLDVLIIFTPCQISDIINAFELLQWPCWLVHGITGHNFETRHPSDDSDQVWFPLV